MSNPKKKVDEIVQPHFEVSLTQITFLVGCSHIWAILKIYNISAAFGKSL